MYQNINQLSPFNYSFCPHPAPPPIHIHPFFFSVFFCLFLLFYFCFCVSLPSIVFIIPDTNCRNLCCLSYSSLLLHLITTHLVPHLSLSSVVFITPMLIIGIFYCLDYTSLSLHLFIAHLVKYFIITMKLTYVLGNCYDLYKCH